MFSIRAKAKKEQQEPQEFHQEEIPESRSRAPPAPSPTRPSQTQLPQSRESRSGQYRKIHPHKSAPRAGPSFAPAPREYQSPPECAEKRAQPFFSRRYFNPNASAFRAFGG